MAFHPVLVLASSDFDGGRCVAGIDFSQIPQMQNQFPRVTNGRPWIRPVKHSAGGPLSANDYLLANGFQAEVWDLIWIDFIEDAPLINQPENKLVNGSTRWQLIRKCPPFEWFPFISSLRHQQPTIFRNKKNRVSLSSLKTKPADKSLLLIRPDSEIIWKRQWPPRYRRGSHPQTRAVFTYGRTNWDLPVTDPSWTSKMNGWELGDYSTGEVAGENITEVLLVISLGAPYEAARPVACFKIVATVLTLPMS